MNGRIDRRLSLVFVGLFALVLVVGAVSLYLLGSLLVKSEGIAQESEQVHLAERMHRTLQDFLGDVERAQVAGQPMPVGARLSYETLLESLVARYGAFGGSASNESELREIIDRTRRLADGGGSREDLAATHQRLRNLTERISAGHANSEARQVQQTHRNLRLTIAVNVAFVVVGSGFLLVSQRYFRHSIAQPLRRLAAKSGDIARGERPPAMPITSSDEIGRLSQAFNRMAEQLAEHEERLKGMVILEERERLARELHDDLAQDLAFLRLKLIEADRSLGPGVSGDTRRLVSEMFPIVDGAYQNLRQAIFGLRAPDPEASGGFIPALKDYLDDFSRIRKIPVALDVADGVACHLAPQAETQVIRIIHEALTNVVKHARASKATVRVDRDEGTARITVDDDGRGFDLEQVSKDGLHFGLQTMNDRASAVGGTLAIDSAPGRGTRVTIQLPLQSQEL